jgi:predicted transcriptional regulator of viral defense system
MACAAVKRHIKRVATEQDGSLTEDDVRRIGWWTGVSLMEGLSELMHLGEIEQDHNGRYHLVQTERAP